MDRDSFGRQQRRQLRELAGLAWERELAAELRLLSNHFDDWRGGRLGPHELSECIHAFHDGAARALYVLYTRVHPAQLVARGVAYDVISETEIPSALLAKLSQSIEFFRADRAAPATDDSDLEEGEGDASNDAHAS